MSELLNSITFNKKTQMDLFHKQIDLLLSFNDRLKNEDWENDKITMSINDDGNYITLSWCQCFDGEHFAFIDPYHYVARDGSVGEYLDIDEEGKYTIPMGEFSHTFDISGEDLMKFIRSKRDHECEELAKQIEKERRQEKEGK